MSACVGAWLSAEFALSWIYVQATREAGANAQPIPKLKFEWQRITNRKTEV